MLRDQATTLICNHKELAMGMRVSMAANVISTQPSREEHPGQNDDALTLPGRQKTCFLRDARVRWGDHFHFTPWLPRRFSVLSVFYGAAPELMLPRATAATWAGTAGCDVGTHAQGQPGATCAQQHGQGQAGSSSLNTNSQEQGTISAAL